jgi:hypothetical protein
LPPTSTPSDSVPASLRFAGKPREDLDYFWEKFPMNFKLAVLFTALTLLWTGYLFACCLMAPARLGAPDMLLLCGLIAAVSYFATQGAYQDVDRERQGR